MVEGEKPVISDKPAAEEEATDKKENSATERVEEPEVKVNNLKQLVVESIMIFVMVFKVE